MSTTKPLFMPNGDGYDIEAAGVLALLANEVPEIPNPGIQRIVAMLLAGRPLKVDPEFE